MKRVELIKTHVETCLLNQGGRLIPEGRIVQRIFSPTSRLGDAVKRMLRVVTERSFVRVYGQLEIELAQSWRWESTKWMLLLLFESFDGRQLRRGSSIRR